MKAIGIVSGTTRLELLELEPPQIEAPDEVLIEVLEVGICSTDRAITRGQRWEAPPGASHLVLGHEMMGRVVKVGPAVSSLKVGELVVPTVRRGCGQCVSCLHGESDMCLTGKYTERGISKANGYMTEQVVEKEEYLIPVPPSLEEVAVLLEPLSIVEKALSQAVAIQHRLHWTCPHPEHSYSQPGWGNCKKAIVAGAGPIGMLAAFILRLNQVDTYVMATRPPDSFKAGLVKEIGAKYIKSDGKGLKELEKIGNVDIIVEATGVAQLGFELLNILGANGIFIFTGIPEGGTEVTINASALIRRRVFFNQVVFGSINSNRSHFEKALDDLERFKARFGGAINKVITHCYPFEDYPIAFAPPDRDLIKAVLRFKKG